MVVTDNDIACYSFLHYSHSNLTLPINVLAILPLAIRSELYTWGRGANGRLGHGDTDDQKSPTLVEALKDRHIKNISCGSTFTSCICLHKWVSGVDQSVCSDCRQPFGFTRKRRNCYHCGLVYCHPCSSKKVCEYL